MPIQHGTLLSQASQYIPFAGKRPQPERQFDDTDLSINVRPYTSSSSSTATYSSDRSDASTSTSSTAYSSPSGSPTSTSTPFPQHGPLPPHARVATHDAPSSSSNARLGEDAFPAKYAVIHQILRASDLYAVLDVDKKCDANTLRRAYMKRCKACHPEYVVISCCCCYPFFPLIFTDYATFISTHPGPTTTLANYDTTRSPLIPPRLSRTAPRGQLAALSKYPSYPLATIAFQKVSFAYDILSKPSSRRMYDLHGITPDDSTSGSSANGPGVNNFTHPSYTARADETLSGVLLGVFCDFMEGDFQMLRTFLREFFGYPIMCSGAAPLLLSPTTFRIFLLLQRSISEGVTTPPLSLSQAQRALPQLHMISSWIARCSCAFWRR